MVSLPIPPTMKFYQLVKMSTKGGLNISVTGSVPAGSTNYVGVGFYTTQQEAEHNRTLETLKSTDDGTSYHVFELEFPNPAYKE